MKLFDRFYIQLALIFSITNLFAQQSLPGLPLTFTDSIINPHSINTFQLPFIDNEAERERADQIAKECITCGKVYYGLSIHVNLDIKQNAGISTSGGKIWIHKFQSTSAFALQVYFSRFKLPEGARLYLYNQERTMLLGAYSKLNNHTSNLFGTQYIEGDTIYLEYYEPDNAEFSGEIQINEIVHVFRNVFYRNGPYSVGGGAAACNVNISCSLGAGWSEEASSVALILNKDNSNNYYGWCTGTLINNTKQNGEPLFFTARHCVDNDQSLSGYETWIFLFNHYDPNCTGNGSTVSSSLVQSVTASEIISSGIPNDINSDFLLLKLNTTPSFLSSIGATYAGWDVSNTQNSSSVGIHHPMGDVKKISRSTNPLLVDPSLPYHWQVNWNQNEGITEFGSSGSPLFNDKHKVIGVLRTGTSSCTNKGPDVYLKFSKAFNDNPKFSEALDPLGLGIDQLATYSPSGQGQQNSDPCNNCIRDGNETGVDCGGNCKPCGLGCTERNIVFDGNNKPTKSEWAEETIRIATDISNTPSITLRAGNEIIMEPGTVLLPAVTRNVETRINSCGCPPICVGVWHNIITPNGDGKNDRLCVSAKGANRYEVRVISTANHEVYYGTGTIENDELPCVWNGLNSDPYGDCCFFRVQITLFSDCSGESVYNDYGVHRYGLEMRMQKPEDSISTNVTSEGIHAYPNPFNAELNFSFELNEPQPVTLKIYNTLMQVVATVIRDQVYDKGKHSVVFPGKNLSSGIYFYSLEMPDKKLTGRVIKAD